MKKNKPNDIQEFFQGKISLITREFIKGFRFISGLKKEVAIFGSTHALPNNHYYQEARKLGNLSSKAGFTVITGGGPGIMEAGNKGAFEAGGESAGLNIELPDGQMMNKYVKKPIGFHYFFTRKVMLSFASRGYVFFPGGFGTLDEFFEIITLIQTKKMLRPPVVITVGKDYWEPLFFWLRNDVCRKWKAIRPDDLKIFHLVNSAEEAFKIIQDHYMYQYKNGKLKKSI